MYYDQSTGIYSHVLKYVGDRENAICTKLVKLKKKPCFFTERSAAEMLPVTHLRMCLTSKF